MAVIARVHEEWTAAWAERSPAVLDVPLDGSIHHVHAGDDPDASDDYERRLAEALKAANLTGGGSG